VKLVEANQSSLEVNEHHLHSIENQAAIEERQCHLDQRRISPVPLKTPSTAQSLITSPSDLHQAEPNEENKQTEIINSETANQQQEDQTDESNGKKVEKRNSSNVCVHSMSGNILSKKKSELNKEDHLNVVGDVCVMGNESENKRMNILRGKRRLELRTTKKALVILASFLICKIFFIISIVLKRVSINFKANSSLLTEHIKLLNFIQILFVLLSFSSCFFNSFTFIIVTDFLRMEAKKYVVCLSNPIVKLFK
jgi:hypothetical protein